MGRRWRSESPFLPAVSSPLQRTIEDSRFYRVNAESKEDEKEVNSEEDFHRTG
jgi:hypothetical protein